MSITIWVIGFLIILGIYFFGKWNSRPADWKPDEVSELLLQWINNNVDDRAWDYFESCEIANPKLEAIRMRVLDAVQFKSPFIESAGKKGVRLNEKGKKLFEELIEECLKI